MISHSDCNSNSAYQLSETEQALLSLLSANKSSAGQMYWPELTALLSYIEGLSNQKGAVNDSFLHSSQCKGKFEDYFAMGPELGRGQFGVVYLVVERSTGARLACKVLNKLKIRTEEQRQDIEREIAVLTRVRGSAHVVDLKAVFEDSENIFLVMERCEGGELFDLVNEMGRFSEPDAADIFLQLLEAVHYCHARNVMHRDIKPENILLAKDPRDAEFQNECLLMQLLGEPARKFPIKLADFGLATFVEPGQKVEGVAGSPLYLAPEVVKGKYDKAADIWSLGVILYILLCGTAPFCGENDMETIRLIEEGYLNFSSMAWKSVSPSAIDLIRRLLTNDPRCRPTPADILCHPWIKKNCGRNYQ